jgi:hypothetical protein
MVTVYRAIAGVNNDRFVDGLVWSLDYGYAASEAIEYEYGKNKPLVLRADVPVISVPYYADSNPGDEVLVIDRPWGEIYENEEDWQAAADPYKAF